jgi:hypothetical protein
MHATPAFASRNASLRLGYAALAALVLAAIVFEVAGRATGYWQLGAFCLGPDLALLYGAATNLEKGRLHPRAVPLYNVLHRFWLPLALMAVATVGLVPFGFFIGGLAWCFHVSLDRAVGYGLRTRDGFQRP